MPTIVLDAAQCDLRQSGAPTALLRDCTIVLVWPITGSYSTARPTYSVKKSYRMWEGAPVSAWLPILISQGGVGMAAAVFVFSLSTLVLCVIGRVCVCLKWNIK